ncbi:MAG: transglycosylase SLT domain-containing protein [Myxococcota bacterium]
MAWLLYTGAPSPASASPDWPMCVSDHVQVIDAPVRVASPWSSAMCGRYLAPIALVDPAPLSERAVEAYRAASDHIAEARYEEARLELDLAYEGLPRVRDYIALRKARLELLRGNHKQALAFFSEAAVSEHDAVRLEATLGYALAALRADQPGAEETLHNLLWTYPSVPGRAGLLYEYAQSLVRQGRTADGAQALHEVRVKHPGAAEAPRATRELERMAAAGLGTPALTDEERVTIARTLIRTGPLDRAKIEVLALIERDLAPDLAAKVHYLAGRLARYEGRWEEAETYLRTAQQLPVTDLGVAREIEDRADDMAEAAKARHQETARASLDKLRGNRSLSAITSGKLRDMVEIASPAGLKDEVDDILVTLAARDGVPSGVLFDATMAAVGTGSEGLVIVSLDHIVTRGSARYRAASLYHLGRAHERAGRSAEASTFYARAAAEGDPYYALWALNGLERLRREPSAIESPEGFAELDPDGLPHPPQITDAELADELEALAVRYSGAYPWLGRAADLLRMDERDAATAELFESYLQWRDALGKPAARAGLDSVARAAARVRDPLDPETRDARTSLTDDARATLSEIATALGDCGTAGGFAGPSYIETLPRAYEWLVVPAANRYGLDPNLLLAVMRVESAYQKHIVSYAGAVGLMQIMPRTGQLIAHAVGHEDFSPADLLDPKTNLEFAAWYLTSLIRRFDGRLPLAIAAYNGGPHNVRRWMQQSPDDTPVDVLLERIPFTQTHRYVRKVLVHYEAYRKQQSLPAPRLSTTLPPQRVDAVSF